MSLWNAIGAGAVARRLIGTVTIVGMVFSSAFAIFLVPVLFVVVERLSDRFHGGKREAGPAAEIQPAAVSSVASAERVAGGGS
ncbi:MAG: hypothetical protein IVW54_09815 [Candidatus Binataceae bacterium]|nr:hypothetical protein [Candidatus Binataceae bacterium]